MNTQPLSYIKWQDSIVAGDKPTVANFARSAMEQDPPKLITTQVVRLDPRRWGFKTHDEMDAAFAEGETE